MRVRFAPSPTGYLHVGGARTALFNWLLARHHGGTFILRIEDTDQARSTDESLQAILDSMRWLGLDWDEGPDIGGPFGPYFQMSRLDSYNKYLGQLLENGHAYRCYCTSEELEARRQAAKEDKQGHGYDGRCRNLSPEQIEVFEKEGRKPAIRLRTPDSGNTVFPDLIHGDVSFQNELVDDFVIVKADGVPTYNYAVVIDDATMEISHVLRGDDHISNTPKQLMIYQALGIEPPLFGHIPMILGPDKSRLSKRHGATSVMAYAEEGYLPKAFVNYLAKLGWGCGDQEIFSLPELIEKFDLSGINKTAAVFDNVKLEWLNGVYMRSESASDLLPLTKPFWAKKGWLKASDSDERLEKVVAVLQERAKTLVQLVDSSAYFFDIEIPYDPEAVAKFLTPANGEVLKELGERLGVLGDWTHSAIEEVFRGLATERGVKIGVIIQPTRVALTGKTISPGIYEIAELMGKEKVLRRIEDALGLVGAPA